MVVERASDNRENYGGRLIEMVAANNVQGVKLMLQRGADATERGRDGYTAMHWACAYGYRRLVSVLLSHGADINVQTDNGDTPLHLSVLRANIDIVRDLVRAGADVRARNRLNHTPESSAHSLLHHDIAAVLNDARNSDKTSQTTRRRLFVDKADAAKFAGQNYK